MRFILPLLLISSTLTQAVDPNYRCDCGEISYYWNPLLIFRDTLSFFRPNWSPLRLDIQSIWNAPKYPDYFKMDVLFAGNTKNHLIHLDFFNTRGAATFNEDFYSQTIFNNNGAKLSLTENSFPWFKKESKFRCEGIQSGNSVTYDNTQPFDFGNQSNIDICKQKKAIEGKIEAVIQSEISQCRSQFWFNDELDLHKSLDIFDFCQTPRIISLQTTPRGPKEDDRYIDSSVRVLYECRNGYRYSVLIEHFVLDKTGNTNNCDKNLKDPSNIFVGFKGSTNSNYCANTRLYLDQTLNRSGFKTVSSKACSCNKTTSAY
jgi:hypothetical protein